MSMLHRLLIQTLSVKKSKPNVSEINPRIASEHLPSDAQQNHQRTAIATYTGRCSVSYNLARRVPCARFAKSILKEEHV